MMKWVLDIKHWAISLLHGAAEILNLCKDGREGSLLLLDPWPLEPDQTSHFSAFESHSYNRHIGEVVCVFRWWVVGFEIGIVRVKREFRIKIVFANLRARSTCFTNTYVQETKLVPYKPAHVRFDGRDTKTCAITVQTHTFC